MKKILICVGTRPNFIKITRFEEEFEKLGYEMKLLHTGQHFDRNMSELFFEQLKIRKPDFFLGIHGGSHSETVGKIMLAAEKVMLDYKPDLVIVPGDVNSTFACAFVASSLRIPVAHIESGLRSFDMDMPEERNRILTDAISDLLFVTEPVGVENLENDGVEASKIHLVGNTMIDSIASFEGIIEQNTINTQLGLQAGEYILATFHRPVNVDNPAHLQELLEALALASESTPVVFPIHPRTLKNINQFKLNYLLEKETLQIIEPQGYIEFMKLVKYAKAIISDSGGIQAEASYFQTPCITVRDTTELKITLTKGTNHLSALDRNQILATLEQALKKEATSIPLWDGKASERIVKVIDTYLNGQ